MRAYQPAPQISAGLRGARRGKLVSQITRVIFTRQQLETQHARFPLFVFLFFSFFFFLGLHCDIPGEAAVRMKLAVTWFWILYLALISAGLFTRNDLSAARRNVSDSQSTGEGQCVSRQVRADYSLIATVVLV